VILHYYRLKIAADIKSHKSIDEEFPIIKTYISFCYLRDWLCKAGGYKSPFELDISDASSLSKLSNKDISNMICEFTSPIGTVEAEMQEETKLGKFYLSKREIDCVLGIAVAPKEYYPICRQRAATDAAASAVASLAVRAISSSIAYLRNQFDVRAYEMLYEDEFVCERIDEFLHHLNKPRAVLQHMSNFIQPGSFHQWQSLITMTVAGLPKVNILYEGIMDLQKILESEIIDGMIDFRRDSLRNRQDKKKGWEKEQRDKIELLFKEKAEKLLVLRSKCGDMLENARYFLKSMKEVWNLDMKKLRTSENCRPKTEQKCPIPF